MIARVAVGVARGDGAHAHIAAGATKRAAAVGDGAGTHARVVVGGARASAPALGVDVAAERVRFR